MPYGQLPTKKVMVKTEMGAVVPADKAKKAKKAFEGAMQAQYMGRPDVKEKMGKGVNFLKVLKKVKKA